MERCLSGCHLDFCLCRSVGAVGIGFATVASLWHLDRTSSNGLLEHQPQIVMAKY